MYDAFRPGRRRLDVRLLREILGALDLDDASIELWVDAAQRAIAGPLPGPVARQADVPTQDTSAEPGPSDDQSSHEVLTPSLPPSQPPSLPPNWPPNWPGLPAPLPRGARAAVLLLVACVAANLLGRFLVVALDLPLHLDMTGTAISAIALGPWCGALVGALTNVLGVVFSGVSSLPFGLVNITGALVWGYGVHRYRRGRSLPAFFSLNVLAALACSLRPDSTPWPRSWGSIPTADSDAPASAPSTSYGACATHGFSSCLPRQSADSTSVLGGAT